MTIKAVPGLILFLLLLLIGCERDLDTKLERSQYNVQSYVDELYWQAESIGSIKPNRDVQLLKRINEYFIFLQ
jgi:hypothetical protein